MDEETFSRAFEDVPTVQLFSARELEEQLTTIRETIADPNKDWSKRVDAVSITIPHLQSIVKCTVVTDCAFDVVLLNYLQAVIYGHPEWDSVLRYRNVVMIKAEEMYPSAKTWQVKINF